LCRAHSMRAIRIDDRWHALIGARRPRDLAGGARLDLIGTTGDDRGSVIEAIPVRYDAARDGQRRAKIWDRDGGTVGVEPDDGIGLMIAAVPAYGAHADVRPAEAEHAAKEAADVAA